MFKGRQCLLLLKHGIFSNIHKCINKLREEKQNSKYTMHSSCAVSTWITICCQEECVEWTQVFLSGDVCNGCSHTLAVVTDVVAAHECVVAVAECPSMTGERGNNVSLATWGELPITVGAFSLNNP